MDDVNVVRRRPRRSELRGSFPAARTVWRCWVICTVVAVLDAVTTWYGVRILHVKESNPLAQWGIEHVGLTATLALRVVLGSVAVGLAALGALGRLPREPRFAIRACWVLLVFAVVFWSAVVVNNTVAIIQHHPLA